MLRVPREEKLSLAAAGGICGAGDCTAIVRAQTAYGRQREDGDLGANVATVQFDVYGNPEIYTLFKLGDDGDYLLDDYGVPIEDTATVKLFKK